MDSNISMIHRSSGGRSISYATKSAIPRSTLYFRRRGRKSIYEKGREQQYLTEQEEGVLSSCIKGMAEDNTYIPRAFPRKIAHQICLQRHSTMPLLQDSSNLADVPPPSKNWAAGFSSRHKTSFTLPKRRSTQHHIYRNIEAWLDIISPRLDVTKILTENIYFATICGKILDVPSTALELVTKESMEEFLTRDRGSRVTTILDCCGWERQLVAPLVIWPTELAGGPHFCSPFDWYIEHSKNGYLDPHLILRWLKEVFEPRTRMLAHGRPRFLISNALGDFLSDETREYCEGMNIFLYEPEAQALRKLPSGTSANFIQLQSAFEGLQRAYSRIENLRDVPFLEAYIWARDETPGAQGAGTGATGFTLRSTARESNIDNILLTSPDLDRIPMTPEELFSLIQKLECDVASDNFEEEVRVRIRKLMNAARMLAPMVWPRDELCAHIRISHREEHASNVRWQSNVSIRES